MARPNKGLDHIDGLQGDRTEKHRLRCILSTLLGLRSVAEVCIELAIGRTYFAMLRVRVLQACLDALAARPTGRPRRVPVEVQQEIAAMRQRIAELEQENRLLNARLELATLPLPRRSKSRPRSSATR